MENSAVGVNIRLRLAEEEEEELEDGAAGGPTLELVFEKEQEQEGNGVEEEKGCKGERLMENDVSDSCSVGLAKTPDSDTRTDTKP